MAGQESGQREYWKSHGHDPRYSNCDCLRTRNADDAIQDMDRVVEHV